MSAENNEKKKDTEKAEVLKRTLDYFWDDVRDDVLKVVGWLLLIAGCVAAVWFATHYMLAFVITCIVAAILGYVGYRLHDAYYWAKRSVVRETAEKEKEHQQEKES